jgi:chitin synthase
MSSRASSTEPYSSFRSPTNRFSQSTSQPSSYRQSSPFDGIRDAVNRLMTPEQDEDDDDDDDDDEYDDDDDNETVHEGSWVNGDEPPQSYTPGNFERYQHGQYLETIVTGETLELPNQPPTPTHDPFGINQYDEDYAPPSNLSTMSYDDYSPADEKSENYDYDLGAYASGIYNRSVPMRSRSPTPMLDDESSVRYRGTHDLEKSPFKGSPLRDISNSLRGLQSQTLVYAMDKTSSLYSEPETPIATRHFGPAPPGRIERRNKEMKRVPLTDGNLVLEFPVPPKLLLPYRGEPETLRTRYTAVTCDPDDFAKNGYSLRQQLYGRRTEIFIVITMYNVIACYDPSGVA